MNRYEDIRYIVFGIDTKSPSAPKIESPHDGKVFKSLKRAKEYAIEGVEDCYFNKFLIGMFLMDTKEESMNISLVETFGFKGNKKDPSQLELWKNTQ